MNVIEEEPAQQPFESSMKAQYCLSYDTSNRINNTDIDD